MFRSTRVLKLFFRNNYWVDFLPKALFNLELSVCGSISRMKTKKFFPCVGILVVPERPKLVKIFIYLGFETHIPPQGHTWIHHSKAQSINQLSAWRGVFDWKPNESLLCVGIPIVSKLLERIFPLWLISLFKLISPKNYMLHNLQQFLNCRVLTCEEKFWSECIWYSSWLFLW